VRNCSAEVINECIIHLAERHKNHGADKKTIKLIYDQVEGAFRQQDTNF
jgi:hypothetical protein